MKLVSLKFQVSKILILIKLKEKFYYQFLIFQIKIRKNYIDGTLETLTKMYTEAGFLCKMDCKHTNKA